MRRSKKRNDNRILEKPPNRIKEFPGYEIEVKLQLLTSFSLGLIQELKKVIIQEGQYQVMSGLDRLSWIFNFDYYGYKEADKIKMAFVLIHHPSTPKFWIRKKGKPNLIRLEAKEQPIFALRRSEVNFLIEEPFSLTKRGKILEREQGVIEKEVFLVGTISREKHYFFVENQKTTRAYSISLDLCSFSGQTMSQLEIEYKWIRGQKMPTVISDRLIREDLMLLSSSILDSRLGSSFSPTKLTKWEWLLRISGLNQGKNYETD